MASKRGVEKTKIMFADYKSRSRLKTLLWCLQFYFVLLPLCTGLKQEQSILPESRLTENRESGMSGSPFEDEEDSSGPDQVIAFEPECRTEDKCGVGWITLPSTRTCITASTSPDSFLKAQYRCNMVAGKLIEPSNSLEEDAIEVLLSNMPIPFVEVWIGLRQDFDSKEFIWDMNRKPVTYTNWSSAESPGSAADTGQQCASMNSTGWTPRSCDDNLYFLCERQPWDTIPLPNPPRLIVDGQRLNAVVKVGTSVKADCVAAGMGPVKVVWRMYLADGSRWSGYPRFTIQNMHSDPYLLRPMSWRCLSNETTQFDITEEMVGMEIECDTRLSQRPEYRCTDDDAEWCDVVHLLVIKGTPKQPTLEVEPRTPVTAGMALQVTCNVEGDAEENIITWMLRLRFSTIVVDSENTGPNDEVNVKWENLGTSFTSTLRIPSVTTEMLGMRVVCFRYNVTRYDAGPCDVEETLCASTTPTDFAAVGRSTEGKNKKDFVTLAPLVTLAVLFGLILTFGAGMYAWKSARNMVPGRDEVTAN